MNTFFLTLLLTLTPTYQCFQHDSTHAYIEINRSTGRFVAEDCNTGYQLKGDGRLRFKGRNDRSFTLAFSIIKDGRHHIGEATFDEKTREFVCEITDGGGVDGSKADPKLTYLLVVAKIDSSSTGDCSRCQRIQ